LGFTTSGGGSATVGPADRTKNSKEQGVDVRIGIIQSPREIDVDLPDGTDRAEVLADVERVLEDPAAVLWLSDKRGRRVAVPSTRIAYVEVGAASEDRRVGFGAPRE
jgi:hypothetical protein